MTAGRSRNMNDHMIQQRWVRVGNPDMVLYLESFPASYAHTAPSRTLIQQLSNETDVRVERCYPGGQWETIGTLKHGSGQLSWSWVE